MKSQQKTLALSLVAGLMALSLGAPLAGANPCAAKNPCGAKNPCAAASRID